MTTEHKSFNWQRSFKIDQITKWYENNRRNANIILVGLIAVVVGFIYYQNNYLPDKEEEASAQLFMAERYFQMDSMNQVLKGDGKYPSAVDVADEFGNTKAGNLARYYAGRAYLDKKDFKKALEYFEDANFDDEIMAAMIIGLRADCQSELGETAKAADNYMKAATKRENLFSSPILIMKAGIHYEEVKKYDEALKAYKLLKEKYSESKQAQLSAKYVARVMVKMGKSPE